MRLSSDFEWAKAFVLFTVYGAPLMAWGGVLCLYRLAVRKVLIDTGLR